MERIEHTTPGNELVEIVHAQRPEILLSVSIAQPLCGDVAVVKLRGQMGDEDIVLRWEAGPYRDIEPTIIDAAWQLGAMDLRRLVFAPLANVNDFMQAGHGITNEFSGCPYHLPDGAGLTSIDDVQKGIRAKTFDETENTDLCALAAKHGRVSWMFKPMAGNEGHALFAHWRKQVPNVDADGWRREPSRIVRLPFDIPGPGQCTEALYRFTNERR
ncbi:MAG: hypothetical protein GX448_11105 [Planctomycetes bacterium]|nr:hypothetical protein [Planctomycetota bacterium]